MKDLFDRNDWLMIGAALLALVGVLVWRASRGSKPEVLGEENTASSLSLLLWIGLGLMLAALLAGGVFLLVHLKRKRLAQQKQADLDQLVAEGPTVKLLPRSDARPVDPGKITLWERLADALPHDEHISFEVSGNEEGLAFGMHGSEKGVRAAMTQVRSEWPGVQQRNVDPQEDVTIIPEGWHLWWCECAPNHWDKPISPLSDEPLRAVFFELKGVMGQGRGLLQVIARNDFGTRKALGEQAFAAHAEQPQNKGVRVLRKREARDYEKRAQRAFLQATIRTVGMADTLERSQGIARSLARAVTSSFGHTNPVRPVREGQAFEAVQRRQMGNSKAWGGHELAFLAHLTGEDMLSVAPRLDVASARSLPADPAMRATPLDRTARFGKEVTG